MFARPRRGSRRLLARWAIVATLAPLAAWAQARAGLEVRLPEASALSSEGPLARVYGVVEERELRELLQHGFPLRIHFRVELWAAARWFDDLRGAREWDVVLRYDPLRGTYAVARIVGEQVTPLGEFTARSDAAIAAERPYRVPIAAPKGRRSYYSATADVEALSVSDLDEVQRWLRGELRPTVRGERNPGTAIGRGLRTLTVRLLGSETRHYETRSVTFRP